MDLELNSSSATHTRLNLVLEQAQQRAHASAGLLGLVSISDRLDILASAGYGEAAGKLTSLYLPHDQSLPGRCARSGEIGLVRNVPTDPEDHLRLAATRTQLVVPFKRAGKVIGLVSLESPDPAAFTPAQVDSVVHQLDQAADALTQAWLDAQITTEVADRVCFTAHELMNSLTSIQGFSDLLLADTAGPLNDKQQQFITTIRDNTQCACVILENLRTSAMLAAGLLRLDLQPCLLLPIVAEVVRARQPQVEARQQTVVLEMPTDLPPILADSARITQVLEKLVTNAHTFTPENGALIICAAPEPDGGDTSPNAAAAVVHVSVKDTGPGLPSEKKRLFAERIVTYDPRVYTLEQELGSLSLYVIRQLVQAHGGRLWFESEWQKGSTFHFTVPVAPPGAAAPPLPAPFFQKETFP